MTLATRTGMGVAAGTLVMTADGALPVEYLAPGDRVVTRAGFRRLVDVQVTTGHQDVVVIAASALGHGRPAEVLVVAADQPVLVRDWRAKAMFGTPSAMVPVARLADGQVIRRDRREVRLYTLQLDDAAVVQAGGMEIGCEAARVTA